MNLFRKVRIENIVIIVLFLLISLQGYHYYKRNAYWVLNSQKESEFVQNKIANQLLLNYDLSNSVDSMLNNSFSEDLNSKSWKIALLVNEGDCKMCVCNILIELENLSESIGYNNILLFGNFSDSFSFNENMKFFNPENKFRSFFIDSTYHVLNRGPYLFVLSEDNKICDFINYEIFRSVHESYLNCFVLKHTKR